MVTFTHTITLFIKFYQILLFFFILTSNIFFNFTARVKIVVLPLCSLYGLEKKWRNVRPAMKKFHNTSSLFAQFRKVLLQHDQLRAEYESKYESTLNEYDNDNEYMNVSKYKAKRACIAYMEAL